MSRSAILSEGLHIEQNVKEPATYPVASSLVGRYEKVISTLVKYGFEDIIAHPPFNRLIPKSKKWIPVRRGRPVIEYTRYERMRMVCEELGTTFIKFAQLAANRPDLLPEELIAEIACFQDQAPQVSEAEIREVFLREFGKAPEVMFEQFDYQSIAAASMAQVHRARLIGGKEVVLKVQRPGIKATIEQDIVILKQLAHLVESYFPQYAAFQPVELVTMFENSIRKELRFSVEAANLMRFQQNFRLSKDIYVPDWYPEFSTDRVLCLEYINGFKINDLEALKAIGLSGPELALKGINLYYEQVFGHGFFHADPHPGNIFVLPDQRVCFVDFGMMGIILESDQELMSNLLLSIAEQSVEGVKKALQALARVDQFEHEKDLEYDIVEFLTSYSEMSIDQIEGAEVMEGLNRMFFRYKIRIPANLLLLLKALVIIEGVGLMLDPKYNIIKNIEPFVRRLLARQYSPQKLGRGMAKVLGDITRMALSLPEDVEDVFRKLREGRLQIEFEHKGLEPLYHKMETVSNRIAFTLLLTALIIGSSLIVIADVPPHVNHVPVLGFVGFIIAGLLAIRLIISILRHGNF
ncbi:MAG TPA: AarF/UbiB family protein [Saprospiraceae bacterium]|nr:AarF/UbiB family protein [Saprospiraceae bacterium]HMP23439.1 AarF/UbiB family protein [Saprospiraceae bacterium]